MTVGILQIRKTPENEREWALVTKRINELIQFTSTPPGLSITLANGSVTISNLENIATQRLLGRYSAATGAVQQVEVGVGLEFSGTGIRRSALTGDVTAAAGSNATTIANNAVTYAKMQDVSAADMLLGSIAGGNVEEIPCTAAGRALLDDAAASNQRTTLGLGTAATQNTGTSGANVPLLSTANTWTLAQTHSAPPVVPTYTVAGVPSASPAAQIAYISNEAGGAVLAFSDGAAWRRCTDRNVIS